MKLRNFKVSTIVSLVSFPKFEKIKNMEFCTINERTPNKRFLTKNSSLTDL